MKSPRFLAALAMAAVLTTGVSTTAHASQVIPQGSFNKVSGTTSTGQVPTQQSEVKDVDPTNATKPTLTNPLTTAGDISLDGTFTKRINNFPTPTQDGHYLRVTMPISMDYTYDVDTNTLTSTDMVITNNSVHATNTKNGASNAQLDYKKIRMSLVNFEENAQGTITMTPGVKFVEDVKKAEQQYQDKVLLPFEISVSSPTGHIDDFSVETIQGKQTQGNNGIQPIEIDENSTLTLKLQKINGQSIGNKDLIKQHTSKTSHNLKLKFEYTGN